MQETQTKRNTRWMRELWIERARTSRETRYYTRSGQSVARKDEWSVARNERIASANWTGYASRVSRTGLIDQDNQALTPPPSPFTPARPRARIARCGQLAFCLPSLPQLYAPGMCTLSRNGKINFTFHRATSRVVMSPTTPVPGRNCTSNMLTSNHSQHKAIPPNIQSSIFGLIKGILFSRSSQFRATKYFHPSTDNMFHLIPTDDRNRPVRLRNLIRFMTKTSLADQSPGISQTPVKFN